MRIAWLSVYFLVLIWSGIAPKDYLTWALEVGPAIIGLLVLALTENRFPLTRLSYILVLAHCVILMIGGHYTYAEVPFFDYLASVFGWTRNNYDKVRHFVQGFVPAVIAREVFIRANVVNGARWLQVIVVSLCLAISTFYELLEWWVALLSGESAEAFLGTQGYVWDTQSDMGLAFLGAVAALGTLGRLHDRQLAKRQPDHALAADRKKPRPLKSRVMPLEESHGLQIVYNACPGITNWNCFIIH